MPPSLRVLLVEDAEDDALLVLRHLRRGGFEPSHERVENAAEMAQALGSEAWDVVISDFNLPRFDGLSALALLRESGQDIPFILVSGTIGEPLAVQAMRSGAQDYVMKEALDRLPQAVERELRAVRGRRERRELEVSLAQADRLANMGMLAAGVAHEINNPLAYVMLHLEAVQGGLEELIGAGADPELASSIESALEGAGRIADIVRDLKSFSRVEATSLERLDLARLTDGAATMAKNEIKYRARLVKDYAPIHSVLGNEGRLSQVLLNLLMNAAQAIPPGDVGGNEIRVSAHMDGDHVVLSVCDTGEGMDPATVERVFEPFFTTKAKGGGTGLGLAICQRIVVEHGGTITLDSLPGQGTEVTLRLPAASEADGSTVLDSPSEAQSSDQRPRVLVVDDEPSLCRSLERTLRRDHDVVTVGSGAEAQVLLAEDQGFDVILCDLMMPHITGMDLHRWVQAYVPQLAPRMLFMTGGAFTEEAQSFLGGLQNLQLDKPFDKVLLLQSIQQIAGGSESGDQ